MPLVPTLSFKERGRLIDIAVSSAIAAWLGGLGAAASLGWAKGRIRLFGSDIGALARLPEEFNKHISGLQRSAAGTLPGGFLISLTSYTRTKYTRLRRFGVLARAPPPRPSSNG